jgi:hypothetical protein
VVQKLSNAVQNGDAICPKCGQKVIEWPLFLLGDATDEILAPFSQSIVDLPSEGVVIVAHGILREDKEFQVYKWLPASKKREEAQNYLR